MQTQGGQIPESTALCTGDARKHLQSAHVGETEAAVAVSAESLTIAEFFAKSGRFLRRLTDCEQADREEQKQKHAKQPAAGVVVKQS